MNPLTIEWIDKADYATAGRELRVRKNPNYDAVCFHAQQMAEKYLKGFLQEHSVSFRKTHDLIELLNLCLTLDPMIDLQRPNLDFLNDYSVRYRYPGDWADKALVIVWANKNNGLFASVANNPLFLLWLMAETMIKPG